MSNFQYDRARSTNIDDTISDDDLRARIAELQRHDKLTQPQSHELRDYEHHLAERERTASRAKLSRALGVTPGALTRHQEQGETLDLSNVNPAATERIAPTPEPSRRPVDTSPGARTRDLARKAIEAAHRDDGLPDYAAVRAEALVTDGPLHSQTIASRWAIATGEPAYRAAFAKKMADPDNARDLWTESEFRAWQAVMAFQSEQRAMGLTGNAGGFMVPLTLDPAILLTNDGSANPLRQIARTVQIATTEWQGVSSAGATAEWKAEAVEAADGSPTLDEPTIPVHFGDVNVPYSYEVGMDAQNFLAELQRVLLDAADQLQAEAFMNGSGTGQPTGLTTGITGTSLVPTAAADVIVAQDILDVQNILPPRFQPNARWLANLTTINTVGSFETANGSLRFPEVGTGNLLRKPLHEASHLDAAGDTATAGNDNVAVYGDFRNFVIVDRIGSQLEILPKLGANGRPTGQRNAFLWFRTGSDVVVDNAFRMLQA
jgi:HK97 family phage major capsid protein